MYMKLLFLTNVPSPYRVAFFNELGKHCELTVLFEKKTSDERDESWSRYRFNNFKGVFLPGKSVNTDTAICPSVLRCVGDRGYDRVIVANYSSPTGILAILGMKTRHIPYWIEGDGGFPKSGHGPKEQLKRFLISGAEGYFSTGKAHDAYYIYYGAESAKIYRYPFTSLNEKDILQKPVSAKEKIELRRRFGLGTGPLVLTVGQFIPRKGFDLLLACADTIRDAEFCFVGGEPTEEYLEIQSRLALTNVHFVGFCVKEDLKAYYQAADLFVLPTREDIWGLVINEAMANGLPVITTDRCGAGLELVENGKNGYIVPVNDPYAAMEAIQETLNNNTEDMGCCALKTVRQYTIESMAAAHMRILERYG